MSVDPCGSGDMLALLAEETGPQAPTTCTATRRHRQAAPPRPRPAGRDVASICALMNGDPTHAGDRERIVAAIVAEATENNGYVNPNGVRARLTRTNADGSSDLTVYPRVVGAVFQGLAKAGVLDFAEWVVSTDQRGRNVGKPARAYHLTRQP